MSRSWRPGDGVEAAMELLDAPAVLAPDLVPSSDQDIPVATYRDWKPEDTRVVQCRISNDVFPGIRYESREDAYRQTQLVHGRILEANYTPGRAFFRVLRVRKAL